MKFLQNVFYICLFIFKKSGQVLYYAHLVITTAEYAGHDIYLLSMLSLFFGVQKIVLYHNIIKELSFFTGRGPSVCGGTRIFWGSQRGGGPFFSVGQRGGPKFFPKMGTLNFRAFGAISYFFLRMPRGDQKKLATCDHRQTGPPPGKK